MWTETYHYLQEREKNKNSMEKITISAADQSIIDSNVLLSDMQETFGKCLQIAMKKNNDYAGEKTTDPFKNIKNANVVGITVEQGILVRVIDKITRVSNLLSQENAVKEESIDDTMEDIINYMAIMKSYRKRNKNKSKEYINENQ